MKLVFAFVLTLAATGAQAQTVKQFVGTVSGLKPESAEIEIKPDNGEVIAAKVSGSTIAQRIAPGERDLKKAETIQITEVASGDRVLVALEPGTADLRRIVVMSSTDITKRNEADRQDWTKRGVSGVVAEKKGNQITMKLKSLSGEKIATVTVSDKTTYRRYAPDSIRFADAKPSGIAEVNSGDQLRARGLKSEDGLSVTAEDIVFGTFQTRAGAIVSVNASANEMTVKEMGTGKTLSVKLSADSQIKALPDFAGTGGGMPGAGSMPGGRGAIPGGGPGGPPDIGQMVERMPSAKLDELKTGQTIIVSSTKGANADQLTAITVVANAGMLIRMASMASGGAPAAGGGRGGAQQGGMGGGMSLGGGGLGIDLSGMTP